MSATVSAPAVLDLIPLARLHPHPLNPHRAGSDITSLVESIRARGQLEPMLVRPIDDGYEVLAGHRRLEALTKLGAPLALAVVLDCSPAEALAILLASNEEREDVDPFLEAVALKQLLGHEGSVKGTAAVLGQTTRWVAQRLSLLELSPAWQQRRKRAPWSGWAPALWQQIARLSTQAQEALAEEKGLDSRLLEAEAPAVGDLEAIVNERLRQLGKAPFDVEDAALVRGTGPCSSCPKTSQSSPGLFDDGEPTDIKHATCRDVACWGRKAAAAIRAKVQKAAAKLAGPEQDGAVPVVAAGGVPPRGISRLVRQGEWTPAKESTKGAVPVVIVGDGGAVTTGFGVLARPAPAPDSKGAAKKAAPVEPLEAKLARLEKDFAAQLEAARMRIVLDAVEARQDRAPYQPRNMIALVLLVGAAPYTGRGVKGDAKDRLLGRIALAAELVNLDGEAPADARISAHLRQLVSAAAADVCGIEDDLEQAGGPELVRSVLDHIARAIGLEQGTIEHQLTKEPVPVELRMARAEAAKLAPGSKANPIDAAERGAGVLLPKASALVPSGAARKQARPGARKAKGAKGAKSPAKKRTKARAKGGRA